MSNVIQKQINTKTLHNTLLMILRQRAQAIIISIPAARSCTHTHAHMHTTTSIAHSLLSFNHQVLFHSVLTYTAMTIDGGHTHPHRWRTWSATGSSNLLVLSGQQIRIIAAEVVRYLIDLLRHTRSVSHFHFDIAD